MPISAKITLLSQYLSERGPKTDKEKYNIRKGQYLNKGTRNSMTR